MRTKCAISYAASEIALFRCCVFADSRLRKNAMVCLRWHCTGLNSTDAYVLSLLDSLIIQTSDFHLSPHTGAAPRLFASGGNISYLYSSLCARRISNGGNNIVLPPQPHLIGGKLPPLPYGGAAHDLTALFQYKRKFEKVRQHWNHLTNNT